MAEGFEPYHVPQQSRRDKLRVVNPHLPPCVDSLQPLLPLYDPSSLISSDFITSSANLHRHAYNLAPAVKEEGINLMGLIGGLYADPHLNPSSSIQDTNSAAYVYASPHCYQPFHGNEAAAAAAVYKPEPQTGGQSLSLSLSSHNSNLNLPLELNLQRYDNSPVFSSTKVSEGFLVPSGGGGGAVELSNSPVPLGPFTGYASVMRGSRFLKPAQQLLEEVSDVGRAINGVDSSLLDPPPLESLSGSEIGDDSVNGSDQIRNKSRLVSMLDEVYKRYKQYYQQMQAAVAAFEAIAGLSNAAPFATLAVKAMSKHFSCLKNAITDQLHFTSKPQGKTNSDRDETCLQENSGWSSYSHKPFHAGFVDRPVWRPQRGLPERAVAVLRAWLFEHFLHPYPTDTDKIMLAKQTGLSRNQVSNWFINARVRLWKPMVEEIHMLETREGQKPSRVEEQTVNDHLPRSCSTECEDGSTSVQRMGDFPLKRGREEVMAYDNLLHDHQMGVGLRSGGGGGNGGVSLTLGLHQNSGMGLPLNAARRLGLDGHDEGYVVSGFAAQNRQLDYA